MLISGSITDSAFLQRLKSAALVSAVAVLLIASVAAPSASALVVGGHSPITILLTDPSGNQFGCTGALCYSHCNNIFPCLTTNPKNDFVNGLGLNTANGHPECSPVCVYYVNYLTFPDPTTWIGIPNPSPGTWTITYYSTLTGKTTGTFTITASSCGPYGKCSVFCEILNIFSPGRLLCDYKDSPSGTLTVDTGSVSGTESGGISGGIFGISSNGAPVPVYNLETSPALPSIGTKVTASATVSGTNTIDQVVFTWTNSNGIVEATDTVKGPPASCGPNCFKFTDTHTVDMAGTWHVSAAFYEPSGVIQVLTTTVTVPFTVTAQFPFGSVTAAMIPVVTLLGYGMYRRSRPSQP